MSGRDQRRRRGLSPEERMLWSSFTRKIEPLHTDSPPAADTENEAEESAPLRGRLKKPVAPQLSARPAPPDPAPPPLVPLTRREKQRVARGRSEIDGRLDLHGLTQGEAHAALLRFLRGAGARDARLVLVITGKSGVLRRQVPQWLGLPEFRAVIIGFESAHAAHGGDGALYVRVRRARG